MKNKRESNFRVVVGVENAYSGSATLLGDGPMQKPLTLPNSAWLLKTGSNLSTMQICPRSGEVLCGFELSDDTWKVIPAPAQRTLGYAIGRQTNAGFTRYCRLAPGNVLQLGLTRLLVREMHGLPYHSTSADYIKADDIKQHGISNWGPIFTDPVAVTAISGEACRICLWTEDEELGPLISPCNCAGTMGVVHVKCLKNWLDSKLIVEKNRRLYCYTWRRFYCELCHAKYPDRLSVGGEMFDLVSVMPPSSKYMVLEVLEGDDRTVYVALLDEGKFLAIGRAPYMDIVLPCISISKTHAYIRCQVNGVFIEDRGSKSGTSLLLDKPMLLPLGVPVVFQAGPALLTAQVKKTWRIKHWFGNTPMYNDKESIGWVKQKSTN